jgi:tRNA G18 (ribose-2'-O)-methylase SpoU
LELEALINVSMIRIEKISSFDAPELRPYATMRRPLEHEAQGIFVAEGAKVVRRLLESHFAVVSAVLSEDWLKDFRPLIEARPEQITVYLADKKWLETLTGFAMFQGVLAVGKIPARVLFEDIMEESPTPRLFAAVDGLTNSENLGALVRNCAAFGVQALIVGETSSSPFLRRAVRNSMGAIFQMPVMEIGKAASLCSEAAKTLAQALGALRERGIRCIAAHPRGKKPLMEADFKDDCCIVFGSEGEGISQEVLKNCDEAVAIPMPEKIDSLNVGAAAAVFLYEANRQRHNKF